MTVLMAEREEKIRSMMKKLEEYLDKKRLMLNVKKTKEMRFGKRREGLKKAEWR